MSYLPDPAVERLRRVAPQAQYKLSAVADSCIALATTRYVDRARRTTFTHAFTNGGASGAAAKENVLAYCEREKGGGSCEVRHTLCAAGANEQVPRYDREAIPTHSPNPNQRFNPGNISVNSAK